MDFLDKLKRFVGKPDQVVREQMDELRKERRFNERHDLSGIGFVQLETAVLNLQLLDISYGGAAVLVDKQIKDQWELHLPCPGFLRFDNEQVSIGLEVIRYSLDDQGRHVAGICFHHESRDSLMLLRSIIEPLRRGSTLVQIDQAHMKLEKQVENVKYMRGEGPIDLIYRDDYFNLLFLGEGRYREVRYFEGKLTTGVTTGHAGSRYIGQSIEDTGELNKEIILHGALILLGARRVHPREIAPVLSLLLTKYTEWQQTAKSA